MIEYIFSQNASNKKMLGILFFQNFNEYIFGIKYITWEHYVILLYLANEILHLCTINYQREKENFT